MARNTANIDGKRNVEVVQGDIFDVGTFQHSGIDDCRIQFAKSVNRISDSAAYCVRVGAVCFDRHRATAGGFNIRHDLPRFSVCET
jgi:hypothetical protein